MKPTKAIPFKNATPGKAASFEQQLRSFSKAAEALFITQPALSIAIRKVEKEIGAAIFNGNSSVTNGIVVNAPPNPAQIPTKVYINIMAMTIATTP